MTTKTRKELFTERVSAGSRTYFLDVKESSEGKLYLVISGSRAVGDRFEHARVMVFEDHLEPFIDGLRNAILFCRRTIAAAKPTDKEAASQQSPTPQRE